VSRRSCGASAWRRLLTPLLFLWTVLCLPWVALQIWRCHRDLERRDWIALAARSRQLKSLGFRTRTTRFWLATAYVKLGQWEAAVEEFERMARPLDDADKESARYCHHVWALHRLGRAEEARTLLNHVVREDWPAHRRAWARSFLERSRLSADPAPPWQTERQRLH
jgi:tetratricopeptide (TPR) repeat protein